MHDKSENNSFPRPTRTVVGEPLVSIIPSGGTQVPGTGYRYRRWIDRLHARNTTLLDSALFIH